MTCLYPEYAIGIRAYGRVIAQDAFALPRCMATAMHGVAVGMWTYTWIAGRMVKRTIWERITP